MSADRAMGDDQGHEQECGHGNLSEPWAYWVCDEPVKGPQQEGKPDKGQKLGDGAPDIQVGQMVGQVGVYDSCNDGRAVIQVQPGKEVHAPAPKPSAR